MGSVVPVMPPTRQPSISSSLYSSFSDQSGFMGDPMAATVTLLQLTQQRLKPGNLRTCLVIERRGTTDPSPNPNQLPI